MPRPEYIARVHEAQYDLRTCDRSQRSEMLRQYRDILAEASRIAGCSALALEQPSIAITKCGLKHERLPKID